MSLNHKSQSALEYMMTYGWAILVIVIVAAVLYSLGIFSPSSAISATVTGFSNLGSVTAQCIGNQGLTIQLGDSVGYPIQITNISVSGNGKTVSMPEQSNIAPSGSKVFYVSNICPSPSSRYSLSVTVSYTEPGQIFPGPYTSTGTLTGSSSKQQISSTQAFDQVIPLTITNSQDNSTPNPYQQMVIVPSSVYGGYAASNFQNVEFFYSNGSIVPSWLQNYTSTNATWWLKLSSISASSSKTVYMGFVSKSTNLFNTVNDGEAPQLSSTYAEYDDGAAIFLNYYNFFNSLPGNFQCDYTPNENLYSTSDISCSSVSSYIKTNDGLSLYTNSTSALIVYFDLSNSGYNLSLYGVLVGSAPFSGVEDDFGISLIGGVPGPTFGILGSNSQFMSGPPPRVSFPNTGQSNFYMWMSNQTLSGSHYNVIGNFMSNSVLKDNVLNNEFGDNPSEVWGYQLGEVTNNEWGQDYYYIAITKATQSMPSVSFGYPSNITKPANIQSYAPLKISNNQNVSVSNFQQMVNVPSSVFTGYANTASGTEFQNLEFFYANGTVIPSWLENYTSSNALYWIKLPSVPAETSFTVYLGFASASTNLFNTLNDGEAPQLSTTYGQYDDGANVFLAYFNGNTPISNFNYYTTYIQLSQSTASLNGNNINVINDTRVASGSFSVLIPEFILNVAIPNEPLFIESNTYLSATSSADNPRVALLSSTSPTSSLDAIGVNAGWAGAYFQEEYINNGGYTPDQAQQGSESVGWVYSSLLYTPGASSYYGYTAPQLYSTTGGYSGSTTNTLLSTGSLYIGGIGSPNTAYTLQENAMLFNWVRARAYPPNGVMPSVSFGSVS